MLRVNSRSIFLDDVARRVTNNGVDGENKKTINNKMTFLVDTVSK